VCGRYGDVFIETGYDDLRWMCSIAANQSTLEELSGAVGFKPGHAARFIAELKKLAASVE
jgi:hypothetical protein